MSLNLALCYCGLFDGLPVDELRAFRRFMDAHEQRAPQMPIETVYDFEAHFSDVLAMFEANDFAQEYAEMSARDPARFPAVPPRLSSVGIVRGLRAMKATITTLGGEAVTAEIERLWNAYGERPLTAAPDAVYGMIQRFLCLARGRQAGSSCKLARHTRPPGRAQADMGAMRGLLAEMGALRGQARADEEAFIKAI